MCSDNQDHLAWIEDLYCLFQGYLNYSTVCYNFVSKRHAGKGWFPLPNIQFQARNGPGGQVS